MARLIHMLRFRQLSLFRDFAVLLPNGSLPLVASFFWVGSLALVASFHCVGSLCIVAILGRCWFNLLRGHFQIHCFVRAS